IALRKGADSEISSGIGLDAASILRAHPEVAVAADGRPLATADLVVVTNKPRLGQPGSSNVTVRGIDPAALSGRPQIVVTQGRMSPPGTDRVIVGRRIAPRFANCGIGEKIRFQQREFTVVGHFTAKGTSFESEIWGDAAVLMPALNREGAFQSITFRL